MMIRILALVLAILTAQPVYAGSPFIWGALNKAQGLQSGGLFFSNRQTVDYNGAINYLGNQNAVDTTGWSTYADAAQATPVDCTGGSPNTTWTTTTTTPQRGLSNFVLTHNSGASRQGEGAAYAFTTDRQDSALAPRALTAYVDVNINDTDYTNGDLAIYVYDVTNAALITPSVTAVTGAPYRYQATFVTTTSTSYRLCVHTAGTGTGAWVANFVNFYVGPADVTTGTPVTDWVSYTPTGSWVSNTTYAGKWRRVGDTMEGQALVTTSGAPTSANLSVNIPAGCTINTSAMANGVDNRYQVGNAVILDSGTTVYQGAAMFNTTTAIGLYSIDDAAGAVTRTSVTQASPMTWASGDNIAFNFSVPCSEWAASAVYLGTGYPEYVSNSSTTDADDTTSFAYGPGGSLVPTITATATTGTRKKTVRFLTPIQVSDKFQLEIQSNGVGNFTPVGYYSGYENGGRQGGTAYGITYEQVAGSTTDIDIFFARGGRIGSNATYAGAGPNYPNQAADRWRIVKIPGQVQVATPVNAVNARAFASATSISGSLATIVWTTEDFDSNNALTSGVFTCPIPGKYQVNAALALSGTFALNNQTIIEIQKNSTAQSNVTEYSAAAVTNEHIAVSDVVSCVTGDTIRIQASSGATGPGIVSSNTKNYLSIVRVGD